MLSLEGISFDAGHQFVYGNLLQRVLLPIAPDPIQNFIGGQFVDVATAAGTRGSSVLLWFRRARDAHMRDHEKAALVTVGEDGEESSPCDPSEGWLPNTPHIIGCELPHNEELLPWPVANFPRRGRTVRVRLYRRTKTGLGARLAEFTFTNPDPGPRPVWKPEQLPTTHRNGNITVTLLKVVTGAKREFNPRRVDSGEEPWTHLLIRTVRNGRPDPACARKVRYTDATGNIVEPAGNVMGIGFYDDGKTWNMYPGGLWSDEAAYKVHLEVFDRPFDFIVKPSKPAGK